MSRSPSKRPDKLAAHPPSTEVINARLEDFFARTAAGVKPGLDAIRVLVERLGHPELAVPCVHIAGTNGKGSTASMIERLLREAGLKTGIYTSPHLACFNERIRINGTMISDADLIRRLDEIDAADLDNPERPCTFFERSTAMAFQHFAAEQVDIAVIETGLGGRLDATNVVNPLVSVITHIDLDHTNYLGTDLATIASEKAGIFKPGRMAVSSAQIPVVRDRLIEEAYKLDIDLAFADEVASYENGVLAVLDQEYDPIGLSLPGKHQEENLLTAATATALLLDELDAELPANGWLEALADIQWPGRFQVVPGEPTLIVDGAHNPSGARVLKQTLAEEFPGETVSWILSFLEDKDAETVLGILDPDPAHTWLVPLHQARGRKAESLAKLLPGAQIATLDEALDATAKKPDRLVCLSGSLYLIGDWLKRHQGDGNSTTR